MIFDVSFAAPPPYPPPPGGRVSVVCLVIARSPGTRREPSPPEGEGRERGSHEHGAGRFSLSDTRRGSVA